MAPNVMLPTPERLNIICNTISPLTAEMDFFGTRPLTVWLGLTTLLVALALVYRKVLSGPVAAAWAFFASFALLVATFPAGTYGCYQRAFEASAGQAFIEITLLPLAILLMPEKGIKWCWAAIMAMAVINIPAVWLGRNGLMIAPSFDIAFLAMLMPFAHPVLGVAILATILVTHGTTAGMILVAQVVAFVFVKNRGWPRKVQLSMWALAACAIAAFLVHAAVHAEGHWLTRPVRMADWKEHLTFWAYGTPVGNLLPIRWGELSWVTVLLGTGPGSFAWISMMRRGFEPPFYLQLHSDWLQIATDTGLIGLGLFLGVCARAVKTAWNDAQLMAAMAGIAACMISYHPLRFFPTMFFITLVARKALFPEKSWEWPVRRKSD